MRLSLAVAALLLAAPAPASASAGGAAYPEPVGGAAYGAMFALANFVQPKPREMTITIPQQRLTKPN